MSLLPFAGFVTYVFNPAISVMVPLGVPACKWPEIQHSPRPSDMSLSRSIEVCSDEYGTDDGPIRPCSGNGATYTYEGFMLLPFRTGVNIRAGDFRLPISFWTKIYILDLYGREHLCSVCPCSSHSQA